MKKLLLSAGLICTMAVSAMAEGTVTTTYVKASDKNAINNAINTAIGAGNTHIVVLCKAINEDGTAETEVADASTTVNLGTTPKLPACGTLVIRSNQTDINNLPCLQLEIGANAIDASVGYPSLILENLSLDQRTPGTGAGYIVSNKNNDNYYGMDSCIIKNCDIKSGRAIFREENKTTSGNTAHHIKKFVFEGNKCHEMNILSGNAWRPFYFVSIPDEMYLDNNMFYDMPYASQLINFHKTAVSDGTATRWNIYNNTFLMASSQYASGASAVNLVMINAGAYVDPTTEFNVYNNLFLGEERGLYAVPKDDATYHLVECCDTDATKGVTLLYCLDNATDKNNTGGMLTSASNYYSKYYKSPVRYNADGIPVATDYCETDLDTTQYVWSFDDCYDPDNSDYRLLKSNAFYTAGASVITDLQGDPMFSIPTCVGAPLMYVDKFPVKAEVKVTIEGSKSVEYTIAPEKATYFAGDEVTITLNDHNSYYRTFNTFKGWSDGSMETTRTITLEDNGVDLTATYESVPVVAAFDFSGITKSTSIHEYVADLGDQAGTAKIFAMVADTTGLGNSDITQRTIATTELPYIEGNFQTRQAKFGEDAAEMQMPILSRRTASNARDFNRDYAVLQFSTKGLTSATVDYFVGTDNNASKVQKAFYSLDNETYTDLNADSVLVNGKWNNVKFDLPAELLDKDTVYIKIQGQVNNGDTPENVTYTSVAEAFDSSNLYGYDVFEYLGNIMITGDKAATKKGDVNGDGNVDINDVNAVINVICGGTEYQDKADVNNDGSVDINDVNIVIGVICGE